MKTLDNTTANQAKDQISDLQIWGNGDTFKLLCKASSKKEGWMKSTKAMEIEGVGCVVQVTTHQLNDSTLYPFKKDENGDNLIGPNNYPEMDSTKTMKTNVIAEALTFVPGVKIEEIWDSPDAPKSGKVISRRLVSINSK